MQTDLCWEAPASRCLPLSGRGAVRSFRTFVRGIPGERRVKLLDCAHLDVRLSVFPKAGKWRGRAPTPGTLGLASMAHRCRK